MANQGLIEVGPDIFGVTGGWGNAYAIRHSGDVTLVDTGSPKRMEVIASSIRGAFGPRARVRHIVITHCHADHIGNLADLAVLTGAEVYVHVFDADGVRTGNGCLRSPLLRILSRLVGLRRAAGADVDVSLVGGETLSSAAGLIAIHTPGHTPGHLAFLLPSEAVLFAGDAAAEKHGQMRPRPAIFNVDHATAMKSFRGLAESSSYRTICFGHGNPIVRPTSSPAGISGRAGGR